MNKIGIHFGFWSRDRAPDFIPYINKAAELGFDILEVSAFALMDYSTGKREDIRKAGIDQGIELNFITGVPDQYDISSDDQSMRTKGIEYIKKNIELVFRMGGTRLSGIIYGPWCAVPKNGRNREYYRDMSVSSMKSIIKTAEECNVQINLEVVNRFEQFILNTSRQAVEYIEMVGSPKLKMLLDTFHLNIEEDSIGEAIEFAGAQLGHFHICENNRKLPGDGSMDWEEIAGALKKIHYSGPLVIESFLRTGGTVPDLLKIWRDMDNGNPDRAAASSLTFIKQCFSTE
jgi:D-psicose/D-tagatose/L-ribulose 3-epimerase